MRTSGAAAADSSVVGALGVAADVADAGIEQALAVEMFTVEVLDAPEATGGDGAFLSVGGEVLGGAVGVEAHAGSGGEGAEEAGDEVGHCGGHEEGGDGEGEGCG